MNSKLTKVLALLLVSVMVMGIFAGCGSKTEPAATEAAPAATEAATEAATATATADTIVYANDYMSEKFSPFFADTSYDQDAAGMTQVSLLSSDRRQRGPDGQRRSGHSLQRN